MSKTCRVVVGGLNPAGLFFVERLGLSTEFELVGVYDPSPERLRLVKGSNLIVWQQGYLPDAARDVDVVFLCDQISNSDVSAVIDSGRNLVIHQPWMLSSSELMAFHEASMKRSKLATVSAVRRWSAEFLAVTAALRTERLGPIRAAQVCSLEKCIPDQGGSTALREFGYAWFDQLLAMCPSQPLRVYGRCFNGTDAGDRQGFLSVIEFADGCNAQVEVITNSRLGHRTGWMLEGTSGSYRNDRLYTETPDGEIVDEPAPKPEPSSADTFLKEVARACRGESTELVTLSHAANVVRLIEAIERSAETKQVVDVVA